MKIMSNFDKKIKHTKVSFYFKLGFILLLVILLSFVDYQIHKSIEVSYGLEDNTIKWIFITSISILILGLISAFLSLTVKEYKMYFKRKDFSIVGKHILSFEDIFENENRKKIIAKILQEPGIHNNELLRQCDLQKGQLQWHLYVLMQYGIIKKEKVGQFSVFFPIKMAKDPNQYSRLLIGKSKTSLKVLDLIEKNPGINSSTIALQLFLNRSTVKYHIDKLKKKDLVLFKPKGRKIELFPNKNFS